MWQHKQEERELKRVEGDIIKKQRSLRKEMRDFENGESNLMKLLVRIMSCCKDK